MAETANFWIADGDALGDKGKLEEAIISYDKALALEPKNGEALASKADKLRKLHKLEESITFFVKAEECGYKENWSMNWHASSLLDLGRREEAVIAFDRGIARDPNHGHYYRNKGNALTALGRTDEAINSFETALKLDPKAQDVHAQLGALYVDAGNREKAMNCFNEGLGIAPKDYKLNLFKGRLLAEDGKLQEALEQYNKANPGIELNYEKGNIQMKIGNKDSALEFYKKATEMAATHAVAYCVRGQCFSLIGKKKESLEDFKKAQHESETNFDNNYAPYLVRFMKDTLSSVIETETISQEVEEKMNKLDQNNPHVKVFVQKFAQIRDEKNAIQNNVMSKMSQQQDAKDAKVDANQLDEIKLMLNKMSAEMQQMKVNVAEVKTKVSKMESEIQDMKVELDNKLDDFEKKLESELQKRDFRPDDIAVLLGYFRAFIQTFSSVHTTSQVIDSGLVQIDSGSLTTSLLSTIASFAPFCGDALSSTITTVGEFLKSREIKESARKMKHLAADPTALSQLIGKVAHDIVLDENKQKQLLKTEEGDPELEKTSAGIFKKLVNFCGKMSDKLDVYLYSELYRTPSERIGHNDANQLIEGWVKGIITPYNVKMQFTEGILGSKVDGKSGSPDNSPLRAPYSPEKQGDPPTKTSCCNIF